MKAARHAIQFARAEGKVSATHVFERWVLPQDAEDDLLRSVLPAFEN